MNLKDIMKRIFQKKDPVALAQKGIEQVQEVIENAEQDNKDTVIEDALKVATKVTENLTARMSKEQKGKFLQEFTTVLVEQPKIPNDVPTEYIGSMIKREEIPNEYIIEPAKDLPDEELSQLTQKTSIPIDDRKELIDSIEDEKIKQQQQEKLEQEEKRIIEMKKRRVIDSLEKLYNKCDELPRDVDVSDKIYEILYTDNGAYTEDARYLSKKDIDSQIAKIVAKRIAHNINRYGSTQLNYLCQILPAKDMRRLGVISMAINEYSNIEEKSGRLDQEELTAAIVRMESKAIEKSGYNEKEEFEKIRYKLLQLSPEVRKDAIKKMNDYVSEKISEKNESTQNLEDNSPGSNSGLGER